MSEMLRKIERNIDRPVIWCENLRPGTRRKVGAIAAGLALIGAGVAHELTPPQEKAERVSLSKVLKQPEAYDGKRIDVEGYADYISSKSHDELTNYIGPNGIALINSHKVIDLTYDLYRSPDMSGAHIRVTDTEEGHILPTPVSPDPSSVMSDGAVEVIGTLESTSNDDYQSYVLHADSVRSEQN